MERQKIKDEVLEIKRWWQSPRFQEVQQRPYTAEQVAVLRSSDLPPSCYPSNIMAKKLWDVLQIKRHENGFSHTFGALDPVQVIQMAPHVSTIYVSGWQCSSTASTTNEPGPDFADYPMDTVPNKVDQLFRAQQLHDRKQKQARSLMSNAELKANPPVDYLTPIIADGDTGHGGLTACMKLMKLFIEAGAAGVHLEDQKQGVKKCGHMGGKVLVSVQEHVDRLVAARLQADIMGVETILIARTDADAATFLDNNIDSRDHPFILGCTTPGMTPLNEVVSLAKSRGESVEDIEALTHRWIDEAKLMRYPEAVGQFIKKKPGLSMSKKCELLQLWHEKAYSLSHFEARKLATQLSLDVYFDWESPRSREGYYRIQGGLDYAVMRSKAYAPYCDLLWMETSRPDVEECRAFAFGVHRTFPRKMLAYNLSSSFNWDAAGMSDEQIASFQQSIARMGYTWQFITLAGFHVNGLAITQFARKYGQDGVIAYVNDIQRQESKRRVSLLTHQTWSGAHLADNILSVLTGGLASTASLGAGATESQFQEWNSNRSSRL